jgi:hypothetical protein
MMASISQTSSKKNIPVALAAGTHSWLPTPESKAFQDDVLAIMREHAITRLDTSRSYVRPPDHFSLRAALIMRVLMSSKYLGGGCFRGHTRK